MLGLKKDRKPVAELVPIFYRSFLYVDTDSERIQLHFQDWDTRESAGTTALSVSFAMLYFRV